MVVHGFGEHCGWYEEFGISLSKLGFFVAAHDHGIHFVYNIKGEQCFKHVN